METIMKILIALGCSLIIFLGTLIIFIINFQPSSRSRAADPNGSSAASSSRSRMAARWAHMDQASRRGRSQSNVDDEPYDDDEMNQRTKQNSNHYDGKPDDFGSFGKLDPAHAARSQGSLAVSLVGTGPNGTRTLLMGWFGLDEPTSAGYNTRPEAQEKTIDGDVLPMRATRGIDLEDPYQPRPVVPHHRLPTTEDHDWETRSQASAV